MGHPLSFIILGIRQGVLTNSKFGCLLTWANAMAQTKWAAIARPLFFFYKCESVYLHNHVFYVVSTHEFFCIIGLRSNSLHPSSTSSLQPPQITYHNFFSSMEGQIIDPPPPPLLPWRAWVQGGAPGRARRSPAPAPVVTGEKERGREIKKIHAFFLLKYMCVV